MLATLRSPNAALWWITGGVVALLGLVLYVPPLRDLFGFSALSLVDVLIAPGGGLVSVLCFEVFKLLRRRPTHARAEA